MSAEEIAKNLHSDLESSLSSLKNNLDSWMKKAGDVTTVNLERPGNNIVAILSNELMQQKCRRSGDAEAIINDVFLCKEAIFGKTTKRAFGGAVDLFSCNQELQNPRSVSDSDINDMQMAVLDEFKSHYPNIIEPVVSNQTINAMIICIARIEWLQQIKDSRVLENNTLNTLNKKLFLKKLASRLGCVTFLDMFKSFEDTLQLACMELQSFDGLHLNIAEMLMSYKPRLFFTKLQKHLTDCYNIIDAFLYFNDCRNVQTAIWGYMSMDKEIVFNNIMLNAFKLNLIAYDPSHIA